MNALATEYQDVFQLYLKLGKELVKIMDIEDIKNPQDFIESILATHDCLIRIEQVNSRILRLLDDWEACRISIDPQTEDQIRELARSAKAQAVQLRKLCSLYAQRLQEVR
jgi:hypothetical protein